MCGCVCVCVCVCARLWVCVRPCMRMCVCAHACVPGQQEEQNLLGQVDDACTMSWKNVRRCFAVPVSGDHPIALVSTCVPLYYRQPCDHADILALLRVIHLCGLIFVRQSRMVAWVLTCVACAPPAPPASPAPLKAVRRCLVPPASTPLKSATQLPSPSSLPISFRLLLKVPHSLPLPSSLPISSHLFFPSLLVSFHLLFPSTSSFYPLQRLIGFMCCMGLGIVLMIIVRPRLARL